MKVPAERPDKRPNEWPDERQRLAALHRYRVLDTAPEQAFDDIAQLAADVCETPIALVSLVDQHRQWSKACIGLESCETPRQLSFCNYVVAERSPLIVPDATQDRRFADNPLVQADPAVCFYAGVPVFTADHQVLGTVCVLGYQPRTLTDRQIHHLEALSRLTMGQLELRHRQFIQTPEDSNRFLELVLNTIPLYLFWKDNHYVYQGCNQRWAEMAGLGKPEDVIGMTDAQLPWTDEQRDWYLQCDQQVLSTGRAMMNIKQAQLQADGQQKWRQVNKVPIKDGSGKVLGLLGTIEDITERKQAEEALQRSNEELAHATRLKDEFLANMSHELRTPLNAILGMTEGLQEGNFGMTTQQQIKALQTIERSGHHLLSLINDILDVAKIESGQTELDYSLVSVSHLCEFSLTFVKQQALNKRLQLITQLSPVLPPVYVDERRMRQVLINLLNNAVKFTPVGGCVTLTVDYRPPLEKTGTDKGQVPSKTHHTLRISVMDTGIGISAENIRKLFQPFVQIDSALNRHYTGTGLGLALVKRIVELHGGHIDLTSEVNVGSCFTITLPVVETPAALPQAALPQSVLSQDLRVPAQPLKSESDPLILLAEDNEANINTIASYLRARGYGLLLASNGQEAWSLAQTHNPDLILMDIQMPRMDGIEAIQRVRHDPDLADIPIIALTAMAMADDPDRCLAAGADEYISKPIQLKQLVIKIQALLGR